MGLSLREIVAVFEWLGVDRSHGAVWNWTHALAENQADPPTFTRAKLSLANQNAKRSDDGVPPPTYRETRCSDTEFLTGAGGYLTALARLNLRSEFNYSERNLIEKWFQTVTIRIDRFHSFWRGSPASARRWLRRFRHHYTHDRPNQALDGRTPAEEVLN